MSKVQMLNCDPLPNIPWQERPEGIKDAPIWRYTENPCSHLEIYREPYHRAESGEGCSPHLQQCGGSL